MNRASMTAECFPAVDAQSLRRCKGFHALPQRAHSLSFRFVLRLAQRRNSPALLVLEDDAVFHPEFRERVAALELPDDWQIFYFGCLHLESPRPVSPGLVRVFSSPTIAVDPTSGTVYVAWPHARITAPISYAPVDADILKS